MTQTSEETSLEIVRKLKAHKKMDARLIVWGCLPKINPKALRREYDGITFGEREVEILNEIVEAKKPIQEVAANFLVPRAELFASVGNFSYRTYCYIHEHFSITQRIHSIYEMKVVTGCLGNCAFCAVRKSRGILCSKSINRVLSEFREGLSRGFRYFGLLGTEVGAYGRDRGHTLVSLLNEMLKEKGDYRIGLRNINPYYLNEMFEELQPIFSSGKIWFIDSPVESGSNRILKLMRRRYEVEEFKRCIETLNRAYPNIMLRTQIMVGFPTETDLDFKKSMQLLDELIFDSIVVYSYSKRAGTDAATMNGQVPEAIKKKRFRKLLIKSLLNHPSRKIKYIMKNPRLGMLMLLNNSFYLFDIARAQLNVCAHKT